jgi:CRP-like cAMP-binding protein/membrane protein YdbS with pleckstrin-like domain
VNHKLYRGERRVLVADSELRQIQLNFLQGIRPDEWMPVLVGALHWHQLAPFQGLYAQDTPVKAVYIVVEGRIDLYRSEPDRSRILSSTAEPAGLLGHLEFLLGIRHATNARCAEPCRLLSIDLQAFSRLIYHFPEIKEKLFATKIANRLATFPFMRQLPFAETLRTIACGMLAEAVNKLDKKPNEAVYHEGESSDLVFLIHQGQVCLTDRSGVERHLLGNGAVFGAAQRPANFTGVGSDERQMVHNAVATTQTVLYGLPYHRFSGILGLKAEETIAGEIARREQLFEQIPIFADLERAQRRVLAGFASHIYFPNTHLVVQQGEAADSLWVLVSGCAALRSLAPDGQRQASTLAHGPIYFAERALLGQISQHSTVEALPGSEWLRLYWQDLEAFAGVQRRSDLRRQLAKRMPPVRGGTSLPPGQRRRRWLTLRAPRPRWLEPGEQIVLRVRRHWIAFAVKMVPGVVGFVLLAVLFVLADELPSALTNYLHGLLLVLLLGGILAIAWGTLDYFNDWMTVTDLRVVHHEELLFVNEWRKQAPLEQIQNVDFSTTWLGKLINYGTLKIATAAAQGEISFGFAANFSELRTEILRQREQRRRQTEAASKQNIQRLLEKRLGIAVDVPSRVYQGSAAETGSRAAHRRLARFLQRHMRRDRGDSSIWRKHWMVLLPQLGVPFLLLLGGMGIAFFPLLFGAFSSLPQWAGLLTGAGSSQWAGPLTLSGVLLVLAALAYASWLIADWRNDTYEVSNDEIAHIDRVPLGFSEERKSANLGRIQNVSMSIPSPWHWFFNYGNVTCQTAAELGDFIFQGVPDPRSVAREILTRMERYRRRTEREAATKRAQELPDWFEMYNRIEPDVLEKRALLDE